MCPFVRAALLFVWSLVSLMVLHLCSISLVAEWQHQWFSGGLFFYIPLWFVHPVNPFKVVCERKICAPVLLWRGAKWCFGTPKHSTSHLRIQSVAVFIYFQKEHLLWHLLVCGEDSCSTITPHCSKPILSPYLLQCIHFYLTLPPCYSHKALFLAVM